VPLKTFTIISDLAGILIYSNSIGSFVVARFEKSTKNRTSGVWTQHAEVEYKSRYETGSGNSHMTKMTAAPRRAPRQRAGNAGAPRGCHGGGRHLGHVTFPTFGPVSALVLYLQILLETSICAQTKRREVRTATRQRTSDKARNTRSLLDAWVRRSST